MTKELSQEELKEIFDEYAGIKNWRNSPSKTRKQQELIKKAISLIQESNLPENI